MSELKLYHYTHREAAEAFEAVAVDAGVSATAASPAAALEQLGGKLTAEPAVDQPATPAPVALAEASAGGLEALAAFGAKLIEEPSVLDGLSKLLETAKSGATPAPAVETVPASVPVVETVPAAVPVVAPAGGQGA